MFSLFCGKYIFFKMRQPWNMCAFSFLGHISKYPPIQNTAIRSDELLTQSLTYLYTQKPSRPSYVCLCPHPPISLYPKTTRTWSCLFSVLCIQIRLDNDHVFSVSSRVYIYISILYSCTQCLSFFLSLPDCSYIHKYLSV